MRRILAIITAAIVAGAIASLIANPAHASGPTVAICKSSNNGPRCMNNWFGGGAGNAINYYDFNNGNVVNNGWVPVEIGTVQYNGPNCGGNWPFTLNSGMNRRYAGDIVLQFQWAKNRSLSQFANYDVTNHGGPLEMEATDDGGGNLCNVTAGELFVATPSYLVSVFGSDAEFVAGDPSYVPEWVGAVPNDPHATDNGHPLWVNDTFYFPFLQYSPQAP